ncbi:hypothetical protein KAR91_74240 [Candidatus Pacearchaeota archaeon]|nr:hypothetical protein [Candidatus Pacearchaeota archaeon]
MLTKKDIKAIAEIIKNKLNVDECGNFDFDAGWGKALHKTAIQLANYFATQNPRFDRQKFLDACGL